MKAYANILPLWEGTGVMQRGETWEKGDIRTLEPWNTERIEEEKKYRAHKKRMNEQAQKVAEQIELNGNVIEMGARAYRCNGALRHLAAFKTLIRYAKEHKEEIALWTMKKRAKENDIRKEWNGIRTYLSMKVGNADEMAIAVTIGRCCRGWYVLRGIAIGMGAMDFMLDTIQYLRKKRDWKNNSGSYSEDSRELLAHYDSRQEEDFLKELFEVYRMTLMIARRTYKNHKAIGILEDEKIPVSNNGNTYIVNAPSIKGNSNSGVALCEYEVVRGKASECISLYDYGGDMNNDDYGGNIDDDEF